MANVNDHDLYLRTVVRKDGKYLVHHALPLVEDVRDAFVYTSLRAADFSATIIGGEVIELVEPTS